MGRYFTSWTYITLYHMLRIILHILMGFRRELLNYVKSLRKMTYFNGFKTAFTTEWKCCYQNCKARFYLALVYEKLVFILNGVLKCIIMIKKKGFKFKIRIIFLQISVKIMCTSVSHPYTRSKKKLFNLSSVDFILWPTHSN